MSSCGSKAARRPALSQGGPYSAKLQGESGRVTDPALLSDVQAWPRSIRCVFDDCCSNTLLLRHQMELRQRLVHGCADRVLGLHVREPLRGIGEVSLHDKDILSSARVRAFDAKQYVVDSLQTITPGEAREAPVIRSLVSSNWRPMAASNFRTATSAC